ncbi:MAG TPA: nuclear transport factor 2 family protein [Xanthobacteraceae bacterium]|nr:nuclear transport factor 2 family protein [Xanthobacteraceae bacterium]
MRITRRGLAAAALAIAPASVLSGAASGAESLDQAALDQAIEALRQAMVDADKNRLDELTADQLSYGHSGGLIQDKADFVAVIVGRKTIYHSITLTDATTVIAGNDAIARHTFTTEFESEGKPGTSKVGVLQVWQKHDGHWKLLARQAYRL